MWCPKYSCPNYHIYDNPNPVANPKKNLATFWYVVKNWRSKIENKNTNILLGS